MAYTFLLPHAIGQSQKQVQYKLKRLKIKTNIFAKTCKEFVTILCTLSHQLKKIFQQDQMGNCLVLCNVR